MQPYLVRWPSPRQHLLRKWRIVPKPQQQKNESEGWGIIPALVSGRAGPLSTDSRGGTTGRVVRGRNWSAADVLWELETGGGRVAKCDPTSPMPLPTLVFIFSGVGGKRKENCSD